MPEQRYYKQIGESPDLLYTLHMAGPQNKDQVDSNIRDLLDRTGIEQVAIWYNHGVGPRIAVYSKLP